MTQFPQDRHYETGAVGSHGKNLEALLQNLQLHQVELEIQNEELRHAQTELAQAHDRFQDLYDFAPVGYLTFNAKGSILEANLAAAKMIGLPRQKLVGQNLPQFIARDSQDNFYLHRRQVFSESAAGECELMLQRSDGKSVVVQIQSLAFINPIGNERQARAALIDVAERKRAEAALKEMAARLEQHVAERTAQLTRTNEQLRMEIAERRRAEARARENDKRLSALMASSPVAIITFDARGTIESVNPACCKMFGYPARQMTGADIRWLIPSLRGKLPTRRAEAFATETRGRRKDGTTFPANFLVSEFSLGRQRRLAGFLSDATGSKRLEREILEIREREQQRIGRDLHDGLGQHLHGVSYFCGLLHAKLEEKSMAESSDASRLVQLMADAVKLSHDVATGLQPVSPEPTGFISAVRQLARYIRSVYDVDCRFCCAEEFLLEDHSAATHLYRIVQEAVHNAVKHGRPTRIRISLLMRNGEILLRIVDNGAGLREIRRRSKRLGLQIMRSRADALEGTLNLKRPRGGGTEVVLRLPGALAQNSQILTLT